MNRKLTGSELEHIELLTYISSMLTTMLAITSFSHAHLVWMVKGVHYMNLIAHVIVQCSVMAAPVAYVIVLSDSSDLEDTC